MNDALHQIENLPKSGEALLEFFLVESAGLVNIDLLEDALERSDARGHAVANDVLELKDLFFHAHLLVNSEVSHYGFCFASYNY
jgi:hypothetical protein